MRILLFLLAVFAIWSSTDPQDARAGLLTVKIWTDAAPSNVITITDNVGGLPTPINAPDMNVASGKIAAFEINASEGYSIAGFDITQLTINFSTSQFLTTLTDQTATVYSNGGGVLNIEVTQTLVADPGDIGSLLGLTSTLSTSELSGGALVTFSSQIDALPSVAVALSSIGTASDTKFVTRSESTYLLTNKLVIAVTGSGSASVTATTAVSLPEPASLAIWGLFGFAGAGAAWRRRRKAALAA